MNAARRACDSSAGRVHEHADAPQPAGLFHVCRKGPRGSRAAGEQMNA